MCEFLTEIFQSSAIFRFHSKQLFNKLLFKLLVTWRKYRYLYTCHVQSQNSHLSKIHIDFTLMENYYILVHGVGRYHNHFDNHKKIYYANIDVATEHFFFSQIKSNSVNLSRKYYLKMTESKRSFIVL